MFGFTGPKSWRQYLAVFICALCVAAAGTGLSWMEPLILRSQEKLGLSPSEASWIVSSVEYGEILFTIPAGYIGDWYGRKPSLLSSGPICLVAWGLLFYWKSIYVLYVVRFLQGVALSIVFALAPLYIAEVAEPKVRGMLAGQFQSMWSLGLLFSYATGPYLGFKSYICVCAIVPMVFTFAFSVMPETPYYLLMRGRENDAKESLEWLRGVDDVETELNNMKESVKKDMENSSSWKELFVTAKDRKIFLTVQVLGFVKYMIGTPAMSAYASEAFSHSGAIDAHQASIIFGILLLLSAFFGAFLSDSIGRRPLLIWTCFLIGVSYAFTSGYYYLEQNSRIDMSSYSWVMYLTIGLSTVLSNAGPSSILQTIQGELFPSNTRALGSALTGVTAGITCFIDFKQYQTVIDYFGVYMNFAIFSAFALLGSVLISILIRETAGKSLGEIQTDLENREPISSPNVEDIKC